MKKITLIFAIYCFLISNSIDAQQLFRAGFVGGFNFTQIDGDDIAGYDKIGLNAGFMVELGLDEDNKWSAVMEILYSQKGSRSTLNNSPVDFKISMDYAEIPLLLKFRDPKGGLTFGAGVLLARSVNNKFVQAGVDETEFFFAGNNIPKKWEIGAIIDVAYMFSSKFGLNFRFTNSIPSIRSNCNSNLFPGDCLRQRHRTLAFRTIYMFSREE